MTELLLTLEAAVDSLESDFRPLDFMKEIFKSTPNLNNKELVGSKRSPGGYPGSAPLASHFGQPGHTRSTSYSVSYCMRKSCGSPSTDPKGVLLLSVLYLFFNLTLVSIFLKLLVTSEVEKELIV